MTNSTELNESIAVFRKVSYQYPKATNYALSNVNLRVNKGEILGLIGATGAGKTTLCLSFNGIVPQFFRGHFYGSVTVAGMDTIDNAISDLSKVVGLVFEDPDTQLVTTSVENEIAFALENQQIPREIMRTRIQESLSMVRLDGYEKKHPLELSGGQKQRLAIAATIAVQPGLLVLDEPTSQLDPAGTLEIFATIQQLNRNLRTTIVIASHSAEELAEYADRIALISAGEIMALGTPDEIYSDIDLLEKNQLRPPQVTRTFFQIREKGIAIPNLPVRMKDAETILDSLGKIQTKELRSPPQPPPKKNDPLFSVKSLSFTYADGREALTDITLDIETGEYVLIIGQNGAGKSTLIKHFVNLIQPTSGIVALDGTQIKTLDISGLAKRIGYIAQNPDTQIFSNTVYEEVAYALRHMELKPVEIEERTNENLKYMDLIHVKDRHPLSLPKGERARVVIAAVLAMNPEVYIFDEPTTGQDYHNAIRILDVTKDLHRKKKTVIVITHHLFLMPAYAQRVIVMGKGNILLDTDLRSAFHQTQILRETFLTPPQAVEISQELQKRNPQFPSLLTPDEIADYFGDNGTFL